MSPTIHPHLLIGTSNRHKVEEIAAVLAGLTLPGGEPLVVAGPWGLPAGGGIDESGATFAENALIKARAYAARAAALPARARPRWVLADDSGLCADLLGGAPGIRSARFAGADASDADNNCKLLDALRGTAPEERGAEFVCVLACVALPGPPSNALRRAGDPESGEAGGASPLPLLFQAEGRCRGQIIFEERGANGFGYDPLFYLPSLTKTFAELAPEEKNLISHRSRALRVLRWKLAAELASMVPAGGGAQPVRAASGNP